MLIRVLSEQVDAAARTHLHTGMTIDAFIIVNGREIAIHRDCAGWANLFALFASDAAVLTFLHDNASRIMA